MKWNYQSTGRNSTVIEGVNAEILIASQESQLKKTPSPPHSDAPLPHADSHVVNPPPAVISWSFYPWFGRRVPVLRFKKLGRLRQYTKTNSFPTNVQHAINLPNSYSTMPSSTVFPPNVQSGESNSDKSDSSEEPESSVTEENSETDNGSQDDMNTKPKVSANASVASLNAAAEKGNESKSNNFQLQMPETLEDPSNDGKPTLSSNPKESAKKTLVAAGESTKRAAVAVGEATQNAFSEINRSLSRMFSRSSKEG